MITSNDLEGLNGEEIQEALLRIQKVPIEEFPEETKKKIWAAAKKYSTGDKIKYSKALSVLIYENNKYAR